MLSLPAVVCCASVAADAAATATASSSSAAPAVSDVTQQAAAQLQDINASVSQAAAGKLIAVERGSAVQCS
jgi:hypothetical protein